MSDIKEKYGISGIIALSCLVILILSATFSLQSCKKNNSFKIGVIISLTGPGAHMSEVLDGIQFAAEELNKYGGVNGKKIELIVRDNETNPEKAVILFNEIEEKYKPDLYLTALSAISASLAPLAEKAEVPLLCLVTVDPDITVSRKWSFKFYTTPEKETTPILYFINKLKINNLGILYLDDTFGKSIMKELDAKISGLNIKTGKILFDRKSVKASDAASNAIMYKSIYIIGYPVDIKEILIELKNSNYKGHILAASGASQHDITDMPESDGIYIAAPAIYNPKYPFAVILKNKMEERFNRPLNHQCASGYESIKMIFGLLSDKEISRKDIQTLLSSGFIYTGSLGRISVNKGGHDFDFDLVPAINNAGVLEYE